MRSKQYSLRDIGKITGIDWSTIGYELRDKSRTGRGYNAAYAQHLTRRGREHAKRIGGKIAGHKGLREFIEAQLFDDQSPEAIAGWLKQRQRILPYVSKSHIRAYIKSVYGRRIEAHRKNLAYRRSGPKRSKTTMAGKRMISKRPKHINERRGIGHMEGDFIVSGKSGKGMLLVLTDRNIRTRLLERILPVSIANVERALLRMKKRYPEMKTLTLDNDILFLEHQRLEKLLGIKIYFTHVHSPWEKGSVEHLNKTIRPYVPKSSDISRFSRQFFKKLEEKLNRRFLKVLHYHSPDALLIYYRKRKKNRRGDSK